MLEYILSLDKNLKSEALISHTCTGAHVGSRKVRRARVSVVQTWVKDELYRDARVVRASPFFNYQRRALKGDAHW
jgi:hypothetical protein